MANLGIAVRLELLAEKFKSEAKRAEASLQGIRFQASALGATLGSAMGLGISGISGLLSKFIQTAREAGSAQTVLKNVSATTEEFTRSIKFARELAGQFGQDLIGVTNAFAKFKGAANASGIGLDDQEKIFANITKSIAAFQLSGEEANLTFLAISQMMSKGKISAEELRRQLGERIPVAMEAMARAAGVSIQELDGLLKAGKLVSAEVMPKFAEELAKLSGNVDTNTLESSLGRLKNTFTGITEDWDVYGKFKKIVDAVAAMLEGLRTHVSSVVLWIAGMLGVRLWNGFQGRMQVVQRTLKEEQERAEAEARKAEAEAQRAEASAKAKLSKASESVARTGERLAAKEQELKERDLQKEKRLSQSIDERTKGIHTEIARLDERRTELAKQINALQEGGAEQSRKQLQAEREREALQRRIAENERTLQTLPQERQYKGVTLKNYDSTKAALQNQIAKLDADIKAAEEALQTRLAKRIAAKEAQIERNEAGAKKHGDDWAIAGRDGKATTYAKERIRLQQELNTIREQGTRATAQDVQTQETINAKVQKRLQLEKELRALPPTKEALQKDLQFDSSRRSLQNQINQDKRSLAAKGDKWLNEEIAREERTTAKIKALRTELAKLDEEIARNRERLAQQVATKEERLEAERIRNAQKRETELTRLREQQAKALATYEAELQAQRDAKAAGVTTGKSGGSTPDTSSAQALATAHEQASAKTAGYWQRAGLTIKASWISVITTIRGMMASILPMAVISAVIALITYLKDAWNQAQQVNKILSDTDAKRRQILNSVSDEEGRVRSLLRTYQSLDGNLQAQKSVQTEIERALGLQNGALDKMQGKYSSLIALANDLLKAQRLSRQITQLEELKKDVGAPYQEAQKSYAQSTGRVLSPDGQKQIADYLVFLSRNGRDVSRRQGQNAGRGQAATITGAGAELYAERTGIRINADGQKFAQAFIKEAGGLFTNGVTALGNSLQAVASLETSIDKLQRQSAEQQASNQARWSGVLGSAPSQSSTGDNSKPKSAGRGSAEKDPLEAVKQDAARDLQKLSNKYAAGLLTEEEYIEAKEELSRSYRERLGEILGERAISDALFNALGANIQGNRELAELKREQGRAIAEQTTLLSLGLATEEDLRRTKAEHARAMLALIAKTEGEVSLTDSRVRLLYQQIEEAGELATIEREFIGSTEQLQRERQAGELTEAEYRASLTELIKSTRDRARGSKEALPGSAERRESIQTRLKDADSALGLPQFKGRDTAFDYKKTDLDKGREDLTALRTFAEELRAQAKAGSEAARAELAKVETKVQSMEQALRLKEIEKDVDDLNKALEKKVVGGVKEVSQAASRLKSSFEGLSKAFDPDSQMDGWERFSTILSSLTSTVETIVAVGEAINSVTEAKQALDAAMSAREGMNTMLASGDALIAQGEKRIGLMVTEQATDQALTTTKVAGETTKMAVTQASTAAETTASAAKATAAGVEAKADMIGAAAKVAKAHAWMPFVGVALAGAAVGAMIALISKSANSIPKFANGGIVPGGSGNGDRVLARVNPGELILNKAQQGRLANHLQAGDERLRVQVEGRIRAKDILELYNVETRRRSR